MILDSFTIDPFTIKVRSYLKSEIKELDKEGGVTKVESLNNEDLDEYLMNLYDFPELEHFVLENGEDYDLFLRYRSDEARIDVGRVIDSAYSDYEKNKCYSSIKKLLLVLRRAASPKSEVYGLLGLSYAVVGEVEKSNDYIRISNYLNNERDYNEVKLEKTRERVEKEMKKDRKNYYNQFNCDSEKKVHIDRLSIPNFDEIIGYIEKNQKDIETAGKELGLSNEQIDIIKLIFAREFYKQGDIEKGNYYLNTVEKTRGKTSDVTRLCLEARTNKLFFQYRDNNEPKKLSLIKAGKRK